MKSLPNIILFFFLLFCNQSFCQVLEGTILDKVTQKPLASATVYLDGTTVSTLTDQNGNFKLNSKGNVKPDLVISYVGYLTSRIANPFQYKKIKTYLEEDAIGIAEVFIGKGPFSQKEMLKAFKFNFLGNSKAASSCKIKNEDDLYFFFDVETNILTATSQHPLKIENRYLGYEVNFDLVDFEVRFSSRTLNSFAVKSSLFAGTTFYTEIKTNGKVEERRKNCYLGSSTHLMQTVANNTWNEEGFKFYVDSLQANPTEYFKTSDTLGIKKITILNESIVHEPQRKQELPQLKLLTKEKSKKQLAVVSYRGFNSIIEFNEKEYLVDANGNYTPFYAILFGGYIGKLRAGDMLPTDYRLNKIENP